MTHKVINISVSGSNYQGRMYTYFHERSIEIKERMRPVIVICPGGGYQFTSDREAEPLAVQFLAAGYNAVVLRYSTEPARYPEALLQLAQAVFLLRENAEEWLIDKNKIFVMGFSAGGHLAASLGVFWNQGFLSKRLGVSADWFQPNGLMLCYPVITSGEKAHQGSFINLLGSDYEDINKRVEVSLEKQVTCDTPPTFLWHTATDDLVPVENSILFFQALRNAGVPVEMHIYPVGPHGLALATNETAGPHGEHVQGACENWINLAKDWIRHNFVYIETT